MDHSLEHDRVRRIRFLIQALILSGALNIGFLSTFIYFILQDHRAAISYEVRVEGTSRFTNEQILQAYSRLSFSDLLLRLESTDLVEEGYTKRDLALASLVAFHHFSLDRALGGIPLQKRLIAFCDQEGGERLELVVFAGLRDEHFEAALQFAKTEKWPFTAKGIFLSLSNDSSSCDPSLLEALYCTGEFHSIYALLQKYMPQIEKLFVVKLLQEGAWSQMQKTAEQLRAGQCYTVDALRAFLLSYAFESSSKIAADCFLRYDMDYVIRRFTDNQLLAFLHLYEGEKKEVESLALALLVSQREDAVREKAASFLYAITNEPMPEIYNYQVALAKFCPVSETVLAKQVESLVLSDPLLDQKNLIHKVQERDSLWKISRKYGVSIDAIMKLNQLETDKLRLGKELRIPAKNAEKS